MTISGILQALVDLLKDPLARSVLLTAWLLPCAIQDWRTRHVSNWLTVPLFIVAWPIAALTGTLPLTIAVFIGVYVAWASGAGMGPADGKLAVGAGALSPLTLAFFVVVIGCILLVPRRKVRRQATQPAVPSLAIGSLIALSMQLGFLQNCRLT